MKHAALQHYVTMEDHNGKNDKQILNRFLQYASQCSDPLTVLRQMENRSICIFQPAYWLTKADYLAACGDYANAFQCIDEAISRLGILQDPSSHPPPDTKIKSLTQMLISDMKLAPRSKKRTIQEFNLLEHNLNTQPPSHLSLLPIYQLNYAEVKVAKEIQFEKKQEGKPISKMGEQDRRNSVQNVLEISSSRSCRFKDSINYSSLHTPMRTKDPMRLPKTRDSVEMLKKRKSTTEKSILKEDVNPIKQQSQKEETNQPISLTFKSFPLQHSTKSRSKIRKTVTFEVNSNRIQKVRHGDTYENQHFTPLINHIRNLEPNQNKRESNSATLIAKQTSKNQKSANKKQLGDKQIQK